MKEGRKDTMKEGRKEQTVALVTDGAANCGRTPQATEGPQTLRKEEEEEGGGA
jgi:hypothetical protein